MAPSMASAPELPKETRRGTSPGAIARQLLGQRRPSLVVEIGAGHVDQPRGLLLDGIDHARMAMAGGHHRDAGIEIEEAVAVHVFDDGAFAAAPPPADSSGCRTAKPLADRARSPPARAARARVRQKRQILADLLQGLAHENSCWVLGSCGVRAARRQGLVGAEKSGAIGGGSALHGLILRRKATIAAKFLHREYRRVRQARGRLMILKVWPATCLSPPGGFETCGNGSG